MAIAIFKKEDNTFHGVAQTEAIKSEYGWDNDVHYISKDITDDEWAKIKMYDIYPFSIDPSSNEITWGGDTVKKAQNRDQFREDWMGVRAKFRQVIRTRPNLTEINKLQNYYDAMMDFDLDSLSYPTQQTVEQVMDAAGHTVVSRFEVP